jgi:hypothetical protein
LPGLKPKYKKPWFHRERWLIGLTWKRWTGLFLIAKRKLIKVATDPFGHLMFWRRRAIAGQWRKARRDRNSDFPANARKTSEKLARFAWYVVVVNVGIIVTAGSCLNNFTALLPDTCVHRHYIIDNERAIIAIMIWQLFGVACGLVCAFAPQLSDYRRKQRRFRSFPHGHAQKQTAHSASSVLGVQAVFVGLAVIFPFMLALGLIISARGSTADGMGTEWAKYQTACQR